MTVGSVASFLYRPWALLVPSGPVWALPSMLDMEGHDGNACSSSCCDRSDGKTSDRENCSGSIGRPRLESIPEPAVNEGTGASGPGRPECGSDPEASGAGSNPRRRTIDIETAFSIWVSCDSNDMVYVGETATINSVVQPATTHHRVGSVTNSSLQRVVSKIFVNHLSSSSTPSLRACTRRMTSCRADADMIRAVHAFVPLMWFGALMRRPFSWRSCCLGSLARAHKDPGVTASKHRSMESAGETYARSFPVKVVDAFWSHSWYAKSWQKILLLMVLYNGPAASLVGFALAVTGAVLRSAEVLPTMVPNLDKSAQVLDRGHGHSLWASCFGLVAAGVIWVTWRSRSRVFVDKICVHQTDDTRKQKGVRAIGAIIRHSNNMYVLWDATYVRRMWCVFELAAFAYTHDELEHCLRIFPIMLGHGSLLIFLGIWVCLAVFAMVPGDEYYFWKSAVLLTGSTSVNHFQRRYQQRMNQMRIHLQEFSVSHAACFCCSVEHLDPATGKQLLCDRQLVEGCIENWFGSVDAFNHYVRNHLYHIFRRQLGWYAVPYRWLLCCFQPVVWAHLDYVANCYVAGEMHEAVLISINCLTLWLFMLPSAYAFGSWTASFLWRRRKSRARDWLVSFISGVPGSLLFFGYGTYSIHINSLASAVAGFGAWAVVACVLWHVCGRCMASCDDQSYRAKDAGQVASSDEQHDLAQGIGATDADTH